MANCDIQSPRYGEDWPLWARTLAGAPYVAYMVAKKAKRLL